jgi:cystathionine beta-lyase
MNFDELTLEQARNSGSLKWNYYDADVIPSWVADMDFPAPQPVCDLLTELAQKGNLCYAPAIPAEPVCELFAERMEKRYGWSPDSADMEAMTDIVQAIHIAVKVLCEDDEQVIVTTPSYHPILSACKNMAREMLFSPLLKTPHGWEVDFERLENDITSKTRLLLLVNPHNPSGRAFRRDELERYAEIALRHDLFVAADEIHCDLVFSNAGPHIPFATLGKEIAQRTVTFNSVTKSHNLGGIRCSVAHYGSQELKQRFGRLPPMIRGGSNAIGHRATCIAWQHCDGWLKSVVDYLESNRNFFVEYLEKNLPDLGHIPNEATFLAWVDCSALGLREDPAAFFLREARVGCYSGPVFGAEGEGHIRMNFATSRSILTEKLDRMANAIGRL